MSICDREVAGRAAVHDPTDNRGGGWGEEDKSSLILLRDLCFLSTAARLLSCGFSEPPRCERAFGP